MKYSNKLMIVNFFVVLFLSSSMWGQVTLQGVIEESESGKRIPYVNIGVVDENIGTVSDVNGAFLLKIPEGEKENLSVRFSSIGYSSKKISLLELRKILKESKEIKLDSEISQLDEVVLSSNKDIKTKALGNSTKSSLLRGGFRNAKLGNELGIKIKLKESPSFVKTFRAYVVNNNTKNSKYRLNFYEIRNGLPRKKIIKQNIIFSVDVEEGYFNLDLSNYDIVLNKDCFVTVELVNKGEENSGELFFSAGILGNAVVTRLTSQGAWEKKSTIGLGFEVVVAYEESKFLGIF